MLTEQWKNLLTELLKKVLTEVLKKVLDFYRLRFTGTRIQKTGTGFKREAKNIYVRTAATADCAASARKHGTVV